MRRRPDPSELIRLGSQAAVGIVVGSAVTWLLAVPALPQLLVIAVVWTTVVFTSVWAGRLAGTLCAVACGLWFGYAHTEPRFQTLIVVASDVTLTLVTLVGGIVVSELARLIGWRHE